MTDLQKSLIYLLSCAVNGITPDTELIKAMDMEKIYDLSNYHSVSSTVCIALEYANSSDSRFIEEKKKTIRNDILFDAERNAIFDEFEKQGVWYMPLKGAVLKELYPENGMRKMADNDILYDRTKQDIVKEIMLAKGYSAESVGKNHHDIYHKLPILNFELHTALFSDAHAKNLYKYYSEPLHLMIKDADNNYGYHFSDDDFYVYITAHEYKHFSNGGTGIRSLLDCYVYCKIKGSQLDLNYIHEQCRQLEIADFEQKRRELAMKVFSSDKLPELSESENEMLMYYLTAGTYGTLDKFITKKLKEQSKASYILHSMFPNVKYMRESVSFVDKCPLLYPVGIVYRWGRILLKRRKYLAVIMKVIKKNDIKK